MRLSRFHLHTEKETPAEAEIASHQATAPAPTAPSTTAQARRMVQSAGRVVQ